MRPCRAVLYQFFEIAPMAKIKDITDFISGELEIASYQDVSLNGLQVEGRLEVSKIAAAVDAGLSVVDEAARLGAQILLVHHGLFWGSVFPIRGAKKKILKSLLDNQINLVAVHLPLDAHPKLGNNAALAELLSLADLQPAILIAKKSIGFVGSNHAGLTLDDIQSKLAGLPGANPNFLSLRFGPKTPEKICVVSGSAADALEQHEEEGFDTLITGEAKQFAYHFCKENKLNAFFAGHYATETLGVQRLAEVLSKEFKLSWEFIDEPSGI